MQSYKITVENYDNSTDVSSRVLSQDDINTLLDSSAPYEEKAMLAEINDPTQKIIALVEVSTNGEYYKWHGSCYSKEIFTAMVTIAIKHNLLIRLSKT